MSHVVLLALSFLAPAKMHVFCIAFGCNNDKRNALEGTSFHRLLLNKPSLLKQVRKFCKWCMFADIGSLVSTYVITYIHY